MDGWMDDGWTDGDRLTASGCGLPRCHVIAICIQDWLISGRVAMMVSIVTASLSLGGGCLIVQGVFGIQAHQSNWKSINGEQNHETPADQTQNHSVRLTLTCPLFVAACCTVPVKTATDRSVQSSPLVSSFEDKPKHTDNKEYYMFHIISFF